VAPIICFTTQTAHFCGCIVVRLQKIFLPLHQLQQKTGIMVNYTSSAIENILSYSVLQIEHLCGSVTAQPHTHTTALLRINAFVWIHNCTVPLYRKINPTALLYKDVRLSDCVVAQSHGRAAIQICGCAVGQLCNHKSIGFVTRVALLHNRVAAELQNYTTTQVHKCAVRYMHDRTTV